MRVTQIGTGTPRLAIVGAVHGDEPAGAIAIDRLTNDNLRPHEPVKLIIANEKALEQNTRYIDTDLNRSFTPTTDPDAHEYHLAHRLARALADCTAISIHSTHSRPTPFAITKHLTPAVLRICTALSIEALVLTPTDEGRLFALDTTLIEIETGPQGTPDAADTAYRLAREFLTATGALPGPVTRTPIPVYRMEAPIEKPPASEYAVTVDNFTPVPSGTPFATADETPITEPEAFHPVLVSATGYDGIFGYRATYLGTLPPPPSNRVPD